MQKITPFLWFDSQAEEAANFYTSIFKNSKIGTVSLCGSRICHLSSVMRFACPPKFQNKSPDFGRSFVVSFERTTI